MNVQLLIIDPQNDFCDPAGALFVPGADEDMTRLATMINRLGDKLDDIHVTLDSHRSVDVAHPVFWKDSNGNNPDPFTLISVKDVEDAVWSPTNPAFSKRALDYVRGLEAKNRYLLCVWPAHCIIGSKGHSIYPAVSDALIEWETKNFALVDYVTKGSNIFTEHYSALAAEIEDPEDPTTMMNTNLIDILAKADLIPITGEALSHCVANSVRDIADNFGDINIKKMVLLEDTCSNVPTFEKLGEDFVTDLTARGMQLSSSTEFLK